MKNGEKLARQGQIKPAIAHYVEAQQFIYKKEIPSEAWHTLCWFGNLYGHFVEVKDACATAVALEPENKWYLRARGLNNALIGNIQGAINDFQFVVSQDQLNNYSGLEQHWLEILRQGKNPFTPKVIDRLIEEEQCWPENYEKIDRMLEKLLESIRSGTHLPITEPVLNPAMNSTAD